MLNYKILGLCKKAGKLRQGTDTLNYLLEKNTVELVIFSKSISLKTKEKIVNKIRHYNIEYIEIEDDVLKLELGMKNVKVISITDPGFKKLILNIN